MATLRRIEPLSLAKVAAVLYGGLGLIIGAIVSVIGVVGSTIASAAQESPVPFIGAIFGVGAIVIFPLLYAFFGFIGGLIMSSLYNLGARIAGGVQLDLG